MIVDAQVHVWQSVQAGYDRSLVHKPEPFLPDEVLREMDAAGVDRAVLIPPSWSALADDGNELVARAARERPDRFAAVGFLDLKAPDAERQVLRARDVGLVGMRAVFMPHLFGAELATGQIDWLWDAAASTDLPLMVSVPWRVGSVDVIGEVAAAHPRTRIATQMGWPESADDDEIVAATDRLTRLAKFPNVAVKAKMLPNFVPDDPYPFRRAHAPLCAVVKAFGAGRVFWGSDLSHLRCSYRELVTMFTDEVACLAPDDVGPVMGDALNAWLQWS